MYVLTGGVPHRLKYEVKLIYEKTFCTALAIYSGRPTMFLLKVYKKAYTDRVTKCRLKIRNYDN